MMQIPNTQGQTKPSYVDNVMASNAQKESSAAITGMSRSIDALSRFMMTSSAQTNKTLSSIDTTLDEMSKQQKKQSDDNKKLISSVKNVVKGEPAVKKDHLKKTTEDSTGKSIKSLREMLEKEFDARKEESKKKGLGILGMLAGLLSIGGLMGFLVTGKQEFLFSTIKGLKHAGKLMMEFFTMPLKVLKGAKGLIDVVKGGEKAIESLGVGGKVFKTLQGFFKGFKEFNTIGGMIKGFGSAGKGIGNAVKSVKGVVGGIKSMGDIFKVVGSVFKGLGGAAAKAGGKAIGKTAGKVALKKIPVIGSLMGLAFGIARFSKGDVVGGMLEIASGLTSLLPGIGIPLGLLIDGVLLMNDLKGGKMFGGANKAIGGAVGGAIKGTGGFIKSLFGFGGKGDAPEKDAYNLMGSVGNFVKETINPSAASDFLQSSGDKIVSGTKAAAKQVASAAKTTAKTIGAGAKFVAQKAGSALGYLLGRGVDVSGMNPKVWNNFLGMANEYKSVYGKSMPLNSAYRSPEKQAALYKAAVAKYGSDAAARKWVAPPGKSMHNYGFALDIGDRGGILKSELTNSPVGNIASKWGFDFPMAHEAWHIEPKGLKEKYADVRAGTYQADAPPISNPTEADAYNIKAGALGKFGDMSSFGSSNNAPVLIKMMPEDINMMAVAFGREYRNSMPKTGPAPIAGGKPVNARM